MHGEQLSALADPVRDVEELCVQPLDRPCDLGEAGFQWPMVVEFDDCAGGPVERHPDRSRALGDDILERSPFVDELLQVMADADEVVAVGGPLQLLAGE